jgi:DMSO/TMAO reductase YedYZ molybdopterin-dependent catalytic subunit
VPQPTRGSALGRVPAGAAIGLLTASTGLAVGQLVGVFVAGQSAPVIAVGQAVVVLSPEWIKSFAIRTFGANDKIVLVTGVVFLLAVLAAWIGVLSTRRPWVGRCGVAALGAIGAAAALTRPSSNMTWALPSLAGAGAAWFVYTRLTRTAEPLAPDAARPASAGLQLDRRRFLRAAVLTGAGAATTEALSLIAAPRFMAGDISRAGIRIPMPASPAPTLPAGASFHVPGLSPFFTPNDTFYRVDTALFPPQIAAGKWRLRIHGMVDREIEIDFHELVSRPLVQRDITLTCVSNEVGGPYVGNARWVGALLRPLLDEAGIHPGADQIVCRSSDGMTIGTPTAAVMDGRDAMLAVSMNGQPLPVEHGFPVRMVVPGLYGYVSATKWIVDMELTTFGAYDAYWVREGWAQQATIKTESRIDTPRAGASLKRGTVVVAGIAWAQHTGIRGVQVRADGGVWNEAELSVQDSVDTWRLWLWRWDATPGPHVLEVRAIDDTGSTQTVQRVPPIPNGATGWHEVSVTVS